MTGDEAKALLKDIREYGWPVAICGHEEDGHCGWCNAWIDMEDPHTPGCPWPKLESADLE